MNFNPFKKTMKVKMEEDIVLDLPKNSGKAMSKIHESFDKYPILCIIFSKRGKSWKLMFDWAGLFRKEDIDYYRLKKRKATFKPPQYSSVVTAANGQDVLVLQNLTRDEYYPVEITGDVDWLKFAEEQQSIRSFLINEVVRIKAKGEGFFSKHLPLITMVVMFMLFIVSGWVFWDAMGSLVMQQTGAVNLFASKIDAITVANQIANPAVW
jgi:hypothetical protein